MEEVDVFGLGAPYPFVNLHFPFHTTGGGTESIVRGTTITSGNCLGVFNSWVWNGIALLMNLNLKLIETGGLIELANGSDYEIPPPTTTTNTIQQAPHTVSTIKLPILKKSEYDIWAMKMEHYLSHTDYPIWEVIQKGNGPVSVSTDTNEVIKVLPPKTAEEILARERERKARTQPCLFGCYHKPLSKIPQDDCAKESEDAIKSQIYGAMMESKKIQKYI
ncbi:hypothetical protein Tco_0523078 [Tanacetum coccineum]